MPSHPDSEADRPSWPREAVGGLTTFLTMSYIIVVNPQILATDGTGLSFSAVMTATVLLSSSMTILMGLYAKLPFAVAPGMGLNAFLTYQIILKKHVPAPVALGLVTWAGVAFLAVSVTPLRETIARSVPASLRQAAAAGIGLLLAFIGLRSAGILTAHPVTLVTAGHLGRPALLCAVGLAVSVVLLVRRSPLALLGGILAATFLGAILGEVHLPARILTAPDFSLVGKLDLIGALKAAYVPPLLGILLTDLFDSLSTFIGVAQATGLVDERGEPRNLGRGLLVDALATFAAGLLGTSSGTAYIESAAGIRAGARTGRAAVIAGLLFVPFLFLGSLGAVVPAAATAPALILVGAFMFQAVATLAQGEIEESLPAYVTLLLIPLTSSITQGILSGLVLHVAAFCLAGRRRELSGTTWILALVSFGALLLENQSR